MPTNLQENVSINGKLRNEMEERKAFSSKLHYIYVWFTVITFMT